MSEPDISGPGSIDDRTLAVYAQDAERYVDLVALRFEVFSDQVARFVAALPEGPGTVLDWGAGPGQNAAVFAERGLQVEATDACPAMAEQARGLGVAIRVEPFEALPPDPPRFRGIWSGVSLCHAPRSMMPDLLALAHAALLPGGVLALLMKSGEGEGRDALGRFFSLWRPDPLERLCRAAGFETLAVGEIEGPSLAGGPESYVDLLARKPAT